MIRSALLLSALALSACSPPYDVCGPSTCEGCCTASGECVAGDYDLACGAGGNACNVCPASAPRCLSQSCRAPDVVDAGHDAGTDAGMDAGMLFVTMRYRYERQTATVCPLAFDTPLCSEIATMSAAEFAALRLNYPACDVSQTDADGRLIDCSNNCATHIETCSNMSSGMADPVTRYDCATPKYATAGACAWTP